MEAHLLTLGGLGRAYVQLPRLLLFRGLARVLGLLGFP